VNNYPTHGIARMVQALRSDPGSIGCTTALGWYVTKHALALWSTTPPAQPFVLQHPQAEVDALPRRDPAGLVDDAATVEATSVAVERDGTPSLGIVTALLDDGRRVMANTRAVDTLQSMTTEPWEGRRVKITNDGTANAIAE
jgi:acetyl-CoA C-acetyltransferase